MEQGSLRKLLPRFCYERTIKVPVLLTLILTVLITAMANVTSAQKDITWMLEDARLLILYVLNSIS